MNELINTKEYKAAKTIEEAINDYSWSPQKFAQSVTYMHKTNQQTLIKTIIAVIKKVGAEDYCVDPRNKASHELCANIISSGLLEHTTLPMI